MGFSIFGKRKKPQAARRLSGNGSGAGTVPSDSGFNLWNTLSDQTIGMAGSACDSSSCDSSSGCDSSSSDSSGNCGSDS